MQDEQDLDNKLVAAAQKGDLAAFNQLVTLYETRVYNLAFRMLGEVAAAEDAAQDSFLQAYRALAQYRGGSFRSWLLRIATNICYDRLRSPKRQPTDSLNRLMEDAEETGGSDQSLLEDPQGDLEETALRRELARDLAQALQNLPEEQRVVVVLSDVQGLSYEEIAIITGVSLGTVKSRISRGRLKIREFIQKNKELLPPNLRQ
jgi:RNA polymerase sigma factor (sigma-70 family)